MQRDYRHFISSCINDRLMKSENNHFIKDELKQIDDVDDLHISPFREDGKVILSHLDNDLSFSTPFFDVCHSFIGCFKLKYLIYNWSYDTRINERSDLT